MLTESSLVNLIASGYSQGQVLIQSNQSCSSPSFLSSRIGLISEKFPSYNIRRWGIWASAFLCPTLTSVAKYNQVPSPHHTGICWGFSIPTWFLDIHPALLFVIIYSHHDHRSLRHLSVSSFSAKCLVISDKGNPVVFSCHSGTTGNLLWLPRAFSFSRGKETSQPSYSCFHCVTRES